MNPFWIAVVSAGSAVVGAFVGALPNLLQSRAQRHEREKKRLRQVEAERYDAAIAFVDTLANYSSADRWRETVDLNRAASRLISKLRSGEALVAEYVRFSVQRLREGNDASSKLAVANDVADHIFKYLRGEATASTIDRG
ncbi:hypothetical protein GCM10009840_17920 [Pseudolysinimonas kribbensis]|uniref:Uncharacterized protein n=1 Tax=Pseudolysinimonas kribbensis TaxID=433641 RepID=A0ABQ6K244_9MICO|nr:hypothetical protein [Pseudolysinimonas kribbensis]GMA93826.1 hypothetical protein GCM10025881_06500 [Pseudolysinimonas kribbensis]